MTLSLLQASAVADAALEEGERRGFHPLCVAVVDAGGHLLALKRDHRASIYRPQIAIAKASGCIGMGFGGRELARRQQAMPAFFGALSSVLPSGLLPVPGGVLIRVASEVPVIGAVGISGDTSENDECCAVFGILAAGLI